MWYGSIEKNTISGYKSNIFLTLLYIYTRQRFIMLMCVCLLASIFSLFTLLSRLPRFYFLLISVIWLSCKNEPSEFPSSWVKVEWISSDHIQSDIALEIYSAPIKVFKQIISVSGSGTTRQCEKVCYSSIHNYITTDNK